MYGINYNMIIRRLITYSTSTLLLNNILRLDKAFPHLYCITYIKSQNFKCKPAVTSMHV